MSETTSIPVRLPKETIEALDELAEALGTPNRAEAIRHVLRSQISSVESQNRIYQALQKVLRSNGKATTVLHVGVTEALRANIEDATVPGEGPTSTLRRVMMSDWNLE